MGTELARVDIPSGKSDKRTTETTPASSAGRVRAALPNQMVQCSSI